LVRKPLQRLAGALRKGKFSMAHLYQPTITRCVDENGKRCSKDTPGFQRIKNKSKTWWGRYRDAEGIT